MVDQISNIDGMLKMDFLVALTNTDAFLPPIYKKYIDFTVHSLWNIHIQFLIGQSASKLKLDLWTLQT